MIDVHQHLWPEAFVDRLRARREPPYLDGWTLHTTVRSAVRRGSGGARARQAGRAGAGLRYDAGRGVAVESARCRATRRCARCSLPGTTAPRRSRSRSGPGLLSIFSILTLLDWNPCWIRDSWDCSCRHTSSAHRTVGRLQAELLRVAEQAGQADPGPPRYGATDRERRGGGPRSSTTRPSCRRPGGRGMPSAGDARTRNLRLCFVAAAGLAPVHHERLTARGGRLGTIDPNLYVDTSSYGPQGIDAVARVLGIDQVVHGTDRPYAGHGRTPPRRCRDRGDPPRQSSPAAVRRRCVLS